MSPELVEQIKTLADLGGTVILTVMLWLVWKRLNDVTDKLVTIILELRLQGMIAPDRPAPPS